MLVIPAIDLMDGKVVRLSRGDFSTRTVYSDRPAEFAEAFLRAGARRVHVVDLDGARAGHPVNGDAVRAIVATGVEVELGGGLRSLAAVEEAVAMGVAWVVLGTAAVERIDLVAQACARFPGQVVAGIDARDGEVKVAGWAQGTGLPAADVARRVAGAGVTLVEYTDVSRDGMFTGVDAAGAARLQESAGVPVVASGGVASLADVGACKAAGLAGVIVGKALYEKRMDLGEAIAVAEG
ncbi:MAG TPA: 1-(5-phosphoribosyl)-5-[(5-phosphoribosylamino)methylideneamino]imidazole-4-carboxamide isomerase [Anaeromyxobacteraceae bacterium]|nr:1-(5-phosphoribosyl)-5-[(5-phosphoribosylamino)methylideneamino]imidazole-4-carboxamide isomerase [Anaeromyxobacteraceae bacterium]